jgi:hypothetical protein
MAASRYISASSGAASGGGETLSALAGSPVYLIKPSNPARVKRNNGLAGPECTLKARGTSLGPN